MNQKELRAIEDLTAAVKGVSKAVKSLDETLKKNNSRTNKNTLMYQLVESVKDLGKKLKPSD